MNKRILYLHGYQGSPHPRRIEYLEGLGFDVTAPQIDYDNTPDLLFDLLEGEYDAIVGNSLGGYVGFYLSTYMSIPAVLINPPLFMDLLIELNVPGTEDMKKKLTVNDTKHVILGMDDDVVDPFKVIEWLFENRPNTDLHVYDDMGHKYTQKQFIESVGDIVTKWI